jgi:Protein of unknown function (DUF2950)
MPTNTEVKSSSLLMMKDRTFTAVMLLLVACSQAGFTQQAKSKNFRSAGDASHALYEAVKNGDQNAIRSILGCGPELLSTGDDDKDKANREQFASKYRQMHRLVKELDGTTVLYIGAENWPFPIPLVSKHGKWRFDSDAGSQEILVREIGRNEVAAIQVCRAFQVARPDQQQTSESDPIQEFAVGLRSGKDTTSADRPFHGYYFRPVSKKDSDVLLVAYPAEYRSSGVMTFLISSSGEVYEKDLGPHSSAVAQQVQQTPGMDWVAVP